MARLLAFVGRDKKIAVPGEQGQPHGTARGYTRNISNTFLERFTD
jgi:hypothetical protein